MARSLVVAVALLVSLSACSGDGDVPTAIFEPHRTADSRVVQFSLESCNANVVSTEVQETADEVRVSVVTDDHSEEDCSDGASITLAEPLGDRRLVDETSGEVFDPVPGPRPVAIQHAELDASGRILSSTLDTCGGSEAGDVLTEAVQSEDEVRLNVAVVNESGTLCALGWELRLDEPLGDRPVIDGSTGEAIDVDSHLAR